MKKAKKAFKQAKKVAKQNRRALKALVARQEEATALLKARTARTTKVRRLVPRKAVSLSENAAAPVAATSPATTVLPQTIALSADKQIA